MLYNSLLKMWNLWNKERLGRKMASIRDVAVRAGVGIGTVSRTLNNSGYVSEETRKKYWKLLKKQDISLVQLPRT